jgi:hypothetical protein
MAAIQDYFKRIQTKVDKVVDQTFWELTNPGTNASDLERQMPARQYSRASLLIAKMTRGLPTIGNLIAPEQEVPVSRLPLRTLGLETINHLKIGKAYQWGETEMREVYEMQYYAGVSGNAAMYTDFEASMIGNVQALEIGVMQKSLVLASQIQTTGAGNYTDPLTNLQWQVSYADSLISSLTPAALTTTARWSQSATAVPLDNLEQHALDWYEAFGMWPKEITMRRLTLKYIRDAVDTKTKVIAKRGGDNPSASMIAAIRVSDEEAIEWIKMVTKCDTVTINDTYYAEEVNTALGASDIVQSKFVPENLYYFSEPNNIERAWVPTAERKFAPGLFTLTEEVSKAPIRERSVVIGCCVPFVLDPRKIGFRTVA